MSKPSDTKLRLFIEKIVFPLKYWNIDTNVSVRLECKFKQARNARKMFRWRHGNSKLGQLHLQPDLYKPIKMTLALKFAAYN